MVDKINHYIELLSYHYQRIMLTRKIDNGKKCAFLQWAGMGGPRMYVIQCITTIFVTSGQKQYPSTHHSRPSKEVKKEK